MASPLGLFLGTIIVAVAAATLEDALRSALLYEMAAATLASLAVTPLTQIVDVAVSKSATGQMSVLAGMREEASGWMFRPLSMLRAPAFGLCWFVYLVTYGSANLIACLCEQYFAVSPVIPKLVGVTAANMAACSYKDARVAQLFGKAAKPGEVSRPFPPMGYILFFLRDLLANGAGFTLPALAAPLLQSVVSEGHRLAVAQLLVPAAINLVTAPLHFLAVSLYNNPAYDLASHGRVVGNMYVGATASRILKGLAAYGIGGVSNTALRARFLATS